MFVLVLNGSVGWAYEKEGVLDMDRMGSCCWCCVRTCFRVAMARQVRCAQARGINRVVFIFQMI